MLACGQPSVRENTDERNNQRNELHAKPSKPAFPPPRSGFVQQGGGGDGGMSVQSCRRPPRPAAPHHGRSSMEWNSFRLTNPEGWQKVAGGRSAAETPGRRERILSTLEGCQRAATPPGSIGNFQRASGGIATLNPRLPSGKPPACSDDGRKTNQSCQPTPGGRSICFPSPLARRGCTHC
jgi:hypothetical protein